MIAWLAAVVLAVLGSDGGQTGVGPGSDQGQTTGSATADSTVSIGGSVALLADVLLQKDAAEMRPQIIVDFTGRHENWLRYRAEMLVDGLAGQRDNKDAFDLVARPRDAWIEVAGDRADLRAGYGRLVWGRLDEIQPSDVINPLDTARFLLDGRSAARLPVTFVRGRLMPSDRLVIEGVVVPVFRRGTFDELDEPTSPFNLLRDLVLPAGVALSRSAVDHRTPPTTWSNLSGGGRVSATIGRVDVAGAVYRGFDGFGIVQFVPESSAGAEAPGESATTVVPAQIAPAVVGQLVESFPRFTMVSGDFEMVAGEWAIRGELAAFVDKQFAGVTSPGPVDAGALDGGIGVDRRSGDYRLFGSVLVRREWSDADPAIARTNVSVVGSVDRTFDRDRYLARVFAVVNPGDGSGFVRGLVVWTARDNLAVEGSAGAFFGSGDDTISRFNGRDFVFGRVKYSF